MTGSLELRGPIVDGFQWDLSQVEKVKVEFKHTILKETFAILSLLPLMKMGNWKSFQALKSIISLQPKFRNHNKN